MRALAIALLANNAAAAPIEARSNHGRELSNLWILKYLPATAVTDHERIDLDQAQIETSLKTDPPSFTVAQNIYTMGAYSKPTAVCTISSAASNMPASIKKGAEVYFKSKADLFWLGKAYKNYDSMLGVNDSFSFTYPVPESKITYPCNGQPEPCADAIQGSCWVGGQIASTQSYNLCVAGSKFGCEAGTTCAPDTSAVAGDSTIYIATSADKKSGCETARATYSCNSTLGTVTDAITVKCTNQGKRTLKGFSTAANKKMYTGSGTPLAGDCPPRDTSLPYRMGCPYSSYEPYYKYYCEGSSLCETDGDYANVIVTAAFDKGSAKGLTNGGMSFESGLAAEDSSRKEFIKKGTSYMNTWMYAIREFEDAIDDCAKGELSEGGSNEASTDSSVHAWDEGVAFYVGSIPQESLYASTASLALADSTNVGGVQPYVLANKRCQNFKTCGSSGNEVAGEAKVNQDLWTLFNGGNQMILTGNCADVVPTKDRIVSKMTVPLVQGTLRYAYKQSTETLAGANLAKAKAEGGVFAAGVLPQVWKCSPAHAATIFNNMDINNEGTVDFNAVKAAFEACYPSMGITCAEVGGLWSTSDKKYMSGEGGAGNQGEAGVVYDASPCEDPSTAMTTTTEDLSDAALAGIIVGAVLAGLLLVFVVVLVMKEKSGTPMFYAVQEPASKQ